MNIKTYSHLSKIHHLLLYDQSSKSMTAACYAAQSVLIRAPGWPHGGPLRGASGGLGLLGMLAGPSDMLRVPYCRPLHAHAQFCLHCQWHSKLGSSSFVIWPI